MSLLDDDRIDDFVVSYLAEEAEVYDEVAIVQSVSARFGDDDDAPNCLGSAISALSQFPQIIDHDWLGRQTTGIHALKALSAMSRLRDPRHLHVLKERLKDYASVTEAWGSSRSEYLPAVIGVLVSNLSNEAAEVLLEAAAETSIRDTRTQFMDAVKSIQDFHDARAAWERRLSSGTRRAETVNSLVSMLDDSSPGVRVEALRALATLRAVDHMPAMIRMLSDDDAAVREAARAALDALNAQPVPAQGLR
jgi:HEAT repeat protein